MKNLFLKRSLVLRSPGGRVMNDHRWDKLFEALDIEFVPDEVRKIGYNG